jgi:hypothetical protein
MFTPPEAYLAQREEQHPTFVEIEEEDDHLAPIWLKLIDGIHDLSSKFFFISIAFFVSLGARIIPDAVIIQIALLILTIIFFWVQKPRRISQRDIRERRLTGLYIFVSTLLIQWDAILLMFFQPVELMGMIFKLWQWIGIGVVLLLAVSLMVFAVIGVPQQQEKRYF